MEEPGFFLSILLSIVKWAKIRSKTRFMGTRYSQLTVIGALVLATNLVALSFLWTSVNDSRLSLNYEKPFDESHWGDLSTPAGPMDALYAMEPGTKPPDDLQNVVASILRSRCHQAAVLLPHIQRETSVSMMLAAPILESSKIPPLYHSVISCPARIWDGLPCHMLNDPPPSSTFVHNPSHGASCASTTTCPAPTIPLLDMSKKTPLFMRKNDVPPLMMATGLVPEAGVWSWYDYFLGSDGSRAIKPGHDPKWKSKGIPSESDKPDLTTHDDTNAVLAGESVPLDAFPAGAEALKSITAFAYASCAVVGAGPLDPAWEDDINQADAVWRVNADPPAPGAGRSTDYRVVDAHMLDWLWANATNTRDGPPMTLETLGWDISRAHDAAKPRFYRGERTDKTGVRTPETVLIVPSSVDGETPRSEALSWIQRLNRAWMMEEGARSENAENGRKGRIQTFATSWDAAARLKCIADAQVGGRDYRPSAEMYAVWIASHFCSSLDVYATSGVNNAPGGSGDTCTRYYDNETENEAARLEANAYRNGKDAIRCHSAAQATSGGEGSNVWYDFEVEGEFLSVFAAAHGDCIQLHPSPPPVDPNDIP